MTSLAIATEYYCPNFNDEGFAVDVNYTEGAFKKNFPAGIICRCTERKFLDACGFRKHQKSETHKDHIKNLKQTTGTSEVKKQLIEIRNKYNEKLTKLQENEAIKAERELKHQKEIKNMREKIEDLDDKFLILQAENDELKETNETLTEKIENSDDKFLLLQEENDELKETIKSLKIKLEKYKTSARKNQ